MQRLQFRQRNQILDRRSQSPGYRHRLRPRCPSPPHDPLLHLALLQAQKVQ
jgi:hypothetical protein